MKKIIVLCLLCISLFGYAQEHAKMGLRVAAGFATLHDNAYKFRPAPAYSVSIIFAENNKPFTVRTELAFETKGAYFVQKDNTLIISAREKNKFLLGAMSLNILPQFRLSKNQALMSGLYCSLLWGPGISPPIITYSGDNLRYAHFDTGLVVAYKYTFFNSPRLSLQIDPRLSYSIFNINNHNLVDSNWTRNAVAQLGLNFILGK